MAPTGLRVTHLRQPGADWRSTAEDLARAGVELPVASHPSFPSNGSRRSLIVLHGPTGTLVWGALVEVRRSRLMPWQSIVRIPRMACPTDADTRDAVVDALLDLSRRTLALRLHAELYATDSESREGLRGALARRAFVPVPDPRTFERTILLALAPTEDELFSALHPTGRRGVRALQKNDLACLPITDPGLAPRMSELVRETMTRTRGSAARIDWPAIMGFVATEPDRARLLGVFRRRSAGAEDLLGFALGVRHGNTVEYDIAASSRPGDLRVPLLYAPTWELMRWARGVGATHFDFGGISSGSAGSADPTGGISDFKRYFSSTTIEVGTEMAYVPSARLSAAERFAASVLGQIRRWTEARR